MSDVSEAVNRLHLELGNVTDGDGVPLDDEAIIFFVGDDGSSEIRVSAPNALHVACRIVSLWNARIR